MTFSRATRVALALFAALMVGTLVTQLVLLEDQRTTTDAQLRTAVRQANASLPLVKDAQPLVEELRGAAPQIRTLGSGALTLTRELAPLSRELRPVARDLDTARAGEQLQAAGALARRLMAADIGETTRAVHAAADAALRGRLLRRLLVRTNSMLGELRALHVVEKTARAAALAPAIVEILQRTESIQRETLALQRESIGLQRDTLAIARETERHAESLDRKTGGEPPASAG